MFIVGDAYATASLVDRQVDFVFLANAFHGVPDKPRLARAVSSVLKPGGLFVVVNWHERPRDETVVLGEARGPATALRISPEATNTAVQNTGLKLIHTVEIPPYHYASVFKKNSN
jgi:SAM-dependent methyltransferase